MMNFDPLPFKELVRTRFGLSFEGVAEQRLIDMLKANMGLHGCRQISDYHALLLRDDGALRSLVEALTVNETYFFREPDQLMFLTGTILPRMVGQRSGDAPLHILSAGCSSGEEPYSLAIALLERFGAQAKRLFSIVAGDLSSAMLRRAERARYGEFSFRGLDSALRARYFERDGQLESPRADVRAMVRFQQLNLLQPEFPLHMPVFDVILMRNVTIYFDVPTRRVIHQRLLPWLADDGVLLTSTTETLANDLGMLTLREEGGQYFFSRATKSNRSATSAAQAFLDIPDPGPSSRSWSARLYSPSRLSRPLPGSLEGAGSGSVGPAPTDTDLPVERPTIATVSYIRRLLEEERYQEVVPLLQATSRACPNDPAYQLFQAWVDLNGRSFEQALALATRVVGAHPMLIDGWYLIGLCEKWRANLQNSVLAFRKAVYLDSSCWPAQFYLAGLYAQLDDSAASERSARAVVQILEKDEAASGGISILPLGLRPREARFLCQRRLLKTVAPSSLKVT